MNEKYEFKKPGWESIESFTINSKWQLFNALGKKLWPADRRLVLGHFMATTTYEQAKEFLEKYGKVLSATTYASIFNNFRYNLPWGEYRSWKGLFAIAMDAESTKLFEEIDTICRENGITNEEIQELMEATQRSAPKAAKNFYENIGERIYLQLRKMGHSHQDLIV